MSHMGVRHVLYGSESCLIWEYELVVSHMNGSCQFDGLSLMGLSWVSLMGLLWVSYGSLMVMVPWVI